MRKYSELEDLMCFGCHPFENLYEDRNKKVIRICPQFAMLFWNATTVEDLKKPTKRFDNCGFKVPPNLKDELKGQNYIIPSELFKNFIDFIVKIQIPFFEDYTIVLDEQTTDSCFNLSFYLIRRNNIILLIFIIITLLI